MENNNCFLEKIIASFQAEPAGALGSMIIDQTKTIILKSFKVLDSGFVEFKGAIEHYDRTELKGAVVYHEKLPRPSTSGRMPIIEFEKVFNLNLSKLL